MKKLVINLIIFLAAFTWCGCYKTIDKMGSANNALVLAYPAVPNYNVASSGLNFWNKALLNFDLSSASATVNVSVNLANPLSQSLPVTIGVDEDAVTAFNNDTANHTKYALMPATYYKIENETISLPAGKTDTTFKIIFYPSKFDIAATGYLLPISITTESGQPVHQQMKTVYFHIEKDPFPPYSRTGWIVTGFSSQEASGEGPNNGRVIHILDNDPSTFWHSQWQGALPGPPHWFSFDMGAANELHGVMFLTRQGGNTANRPKDVNISTSNDGVTWTTVTNLTLANTGSWQKMAFSSPTAPVRHLKVTINTLYGSQTYSNLAEFKAY
jgi:hypothetical protein